VDEFSETQRAEEGAPAAAAANEAAAIVARTASCTTGDTAVAETVAARAPSLPIAARDDTRAREMSCTSAATVFMRIIVFFGVSFPLAPHLWAPIRCHASESPQRDTRTAWTDYSGEGKQPCLSSGFNVLLHVTPCGKTQENRPNSIQQKQILH